MIKIMDGISWYGDCPLRTTNHTFLHLEDHSSPHHHRSQLHNLQVGIDPNDFLKLQLDDGRHPYANEGLLSASLALASDRHLDPCYNIRHQGIQPHFRINQIFHLQVLFP